MLRPGSDAFRACVLLSPVTGLLELRVDGGDRLVETVGVLLQVVQRVALWGVDVRSRGDQQFVPALADLRANFCFVFSPAAQAQLAAALRVPDCPAAADALARQVTGGLAYTNDVWLPGDAVQRSPTGTVVDACRLDFSRALGGDTAGAPGPQLGRLTLQQQAGEGHLITAYSPATPSPSGYRCPSAALSDGNHANLIELPVARWWSARARRGRNTAKTAGNQTRHRLYPGRLKARPWPPVRAAGGRTTGRSARC